jgi:hypothetical protein
MAGFSGRTRGEADIPLDINQPDARRRAVHGSNVVSQCAGNFGRRPDGWRSATADLLPVISSFNAAVPFGASVFGGGVDEDKKNRN